MTRNFLRLCLCSLAFPTMLLASCNKNNGDDILSLAVSGTDIAASYAGGETDFYYAVKNGIDGGYVTCAADVDWISGFTYTDATDSAPANVRFSIDENDASDPRSGVIKVIYNSSEGYLGQSINVLQAGTGTRDTDFNMADLIGTYKASAKAPYTYGVLYNTTWTLIIMQKDENTLYIDGLVPSTEGLYVNFSDHRGSATAYLNENSELVVPSGMASCMVQTYYGTYYVGYTPCTEYSCLTGTAFYDDEYPDLTFTYDSSTQTWTADYGILCVGCSDKSIDSLSIYVDQIYPSVTLVKTSDSTPDGSSADSSGDPASLGFSAEKTQKASSVSGR